MTREPGVFISSTFTDLAAERRAVADAAGQAGLRPILFEDFGASPRSPQQVLVEAVRSADLFVLIVAFRYGFIPDGDAKGILELEYEQARHEGKPVLVYMLSEDAPWPVSQIATGPELERVQAFRQRLQGESVVEYFGNAEELRTRALASFLRWTNGLELPTATEQAAEGHLAFGPMLLEIRSQLALLMEHVLREPARVQAEPALQSRPAKFLGPGTAAPDPNRVFVIMPYSMEWSSPVERVIREACESVGAVFDIAKAREGRFVIQDVWEGITGSAITIADLTGGNPNVAYEVGLADVLGREVVLISQESDVPVDFRGARLILYKNTIEGALALRETLSYRLRSLRAAVQ